MEVMQYIAKKDLAWRYMIEEHFDISENAAHLHLWRLKKQGLVVNYGDCWELTDRGYKRLQYIRRQPSQKAKGT